MTSRIRLMPVDRQLRPCGEAPWVEPRPSLLAPSRQGGSGSGRPTWLRRGGPRAAWLQPSARPDAPAGLLQGRGRRAPKSQREVVGDALQFRVDF
jgi:hypothetical protein